VPPPGGAAHPIWIRLLGSLQVQRSGREEPLPASKRTRALLGYLAATGKPQTRQHLCELLWEGPDDPRAALRWSLTKLRPIVSAGDAARIDADRERVHFVGRDRCADIAHVGELLAQGPDMASTQALEQAAALLQGEFLDGLDLPHCYRFHHWCMAERERFGSLRRRVLESLIGRLSADPERSLDYARALVAADPLSEAAHARFVDLLARSGRMREAEAHYEHARDLLRRELAAPLSGHLRRPAAVVGGLRTDAPGAPVVDRAEEIDRLGATAQRAPRLVGRGAETAAIGSALRSLAAGTAPAMLLFTGEPGIGKSRLLQALAEAATRAGVAVVSGQCFEPEMIRAYGLWIDILRTFPDDRGAMRARKLPDPRAPRGEEIADGSGARDAMFAEIASEFRRMAEGRGLAIVLDDLQWIDEGSASLLHYLLRVSGRSGRILFAGAAREGEVADNPWARRLLLSLERVRWIERHAVGPLSVEETASLFEGGLSEQDALVRHRASGGNPLFALEMARRMHGEELAGSAFHDLVAERIDRLDSAARESLEFASAIGRAFGPELLGAALERSEVAAQADLARLVQRGLLRHLPDGQHDFAHDLVRHATYQALPQAQRRMIHRRLAHALADAAARDDRWFGDLAHHAGLAQNDTLAAEACIAAGERCLRMLANTEAERAAERGLAHLLRVDAPAERVRLRVALLRVKTFAAGRPGILRRPQLMDELREVIDEAEGLGLHAAASLGSHVLSWVTQAMNDTGGVRAATLHAEAMSRTADEVTRCQQLANTGRCLLEVEQDIGRARRFLDEAALLAARVNLRVAELDWGLGLVARWDGDLDGAHRMLSRALALARLREDHWRQIECLTWRAKIELERNRCEAAIADTREIVEVGGRIGAGVAPVAEALRALAAYRLDGGQARPALDAALVGLRDHDDKANLAYVLNHYATLALDRGDSEDGLALADEALVAARAVRRITETVVASTVLFMASLAQGDEAAARRHFAQVTALAAEQALSARAGSALAHAHRRVPQSFAHTDPR